MKNLGIRKHHLIAAGGILLSAFLLTALAEPPSKPVDRFKPQDEGKFPSDWKKIQGKSDIYRVQVEDGNAFLAARPDQAAGLILTEAKVRAKDFSRLKWRWRAKKLPVGADETGKNGRNDCAASVYVIFDKGLTKYTKETLRYVWSAHSHPKGMTLKMKDYVYYVIQENGEAPLRQWLDEEVNFLEDYRKLFKKEPPPVMAVGIQSDSDDTKTSSWADYDDFVLIPSEESPIAK